MRKKKPQKKIQFRLLENSAVMFVQQENSENSQEFDKR